jgi:hypothetical protein
MALQITGSVRVSVRQTELHDDAAPLEPDLLTLSYFSWQFVPGNSCGNTSANIMEASYISYLQIK